MRRSEYQLLQFEQSDSVLTVSINRPEKLNSVNGRMHTEFAEVFRDVAADDSVNVVVLTGIGRTFCAGGDLNWFQTLSPQELDKVFVEARQIIIDLLELPQPIISAINGAATGLGATLALLSDFSVASEGAQISDPHVRVAIAAGDGGAIIWPWLIGAARAKQYLMTGDPIEAADAARMGLISQAVPASELQTIAMKLAQRLARGPQKAIRATKASVNKILRDTANLVLDTSLALEKECFSTTDHREAIAAFFEKRAPRFGV